MKRIKCIKCGLRFKDRKDPEDDGTVNKELCWNCRFIWQVLGMTLEALGRREKLNREIVLNLDDVVIRRKPLPLK